MTPSCSLPMPTVLGIKVWLEKVGGGGGGECMHGLDYYYYVQGCKSKLLRTSGYCAKWSDG